MAAAPPQKSAQRAHAYPEQSTNTRGTKKRRQKPEDDWFILSLPPSTRKSDELERSKPRLTIRHKLCMMRTQVMAMEYQLHGLQSKWTEQIPDSRTRITAQRCAFEKYAAKQSDIAREELLAILQRQQVLLASLQTAVLRSPLHSNGEDILKKLHFGTRLGGEEEERERVLMEHNRRSLATIPSIVDNLSQLVIAEALAKQRAGLNRKLMMPLSRIDITGSKDCTLVTSVFVSDVPHTSLEEVYAAAKMLFNTIPAWMKRHFGIDATQKRLNRVESPVAYLRINLGGTGLPATGNYAICSELTPYCGMISVDAITEDPLYPVPTNRLQDVMCALTVKPVRDPNTGNTTSMTLRWIVLYRYNLMPDDPALKTYLELYRPILNGDLITSTICSYLQDQPSRR